jgi:regulator of sirC expression with transglutaminase-like and TPR domain
MVVTTEREIRALITLLGDDDKKVRDIARTRLLEIGDSANQLLREVAFTDYEGRIRIEAQAILEEMRLERLVRHFKQLTNGSDVDLERGCFILSQIEYPDLDVPHYVEKIDYLALEAKRRVSRVRDLRQQVKMINKLLFYEQGFRGNVKSYYDPKNSYINTLLDRRLGIPISLSALYLMIAKRLKLPIYGVGMPVHFILKFQYESDTYYIDTFNAGQILTKEDCIHYLNNIGYAFNDSFLVICPPREILARMIRNLMLIYHQKDQQRKVDILERFISIIGRREPWSV